MRRLAPVLTLSFGLALSLAVTEAYVTFAKWSSPSVIYYINPANQDVSAAAAEAAVQAGANAWSQQSNANFKFVYGGRVNDTTTGYDNRNVVLFRNTSNGSTIATTYHWTSNGVLVDADIVFWDGGWTLFTGSTGCSSGAYIEDVAAHEFGHALGLKHSSAPDATMYASYSRCSTQLRSLAADDIAGVEALYPPTTANSAPTVTISSPASGASVNEGIALTFTGSASDKEDGTLSAQLKWMSNRDGQIGTGASFTRTLSAGTHTIVAAVTDSGGLSGSFSITVTVTATPTATVSLSARGYKNKGSQYADLNWAGASTSNVEIYRNGVRVATPKNTGAYTDNPPSKGGGSATYTVCEAGTSKCSPAVSVTF